MRELRAEHEPPPTAERDISGYVMSLVVSDNLGDLSKYSEKNVCIIKAVLEPELCDATLSSVLSWAKARSPNEGRGENWWYCVRNEGSEFVSFLFWQLDRIEPAELRENLTSIYQALFSAHVLCGMIAPGQSFDELLAAQGDRLALEPLLFHYPPGTGKFARHAHNPGYQKTQVLINLTKRNRDYAGGETVIEESDGTALELGENFDQGDLFSFPYALFHLNAASPARETSYPVWVGKDLFSRSSNSLFNRSSLAIRIQCQRTWRLRFQN